MDTMYSNVAGLDVHHKSIQCAVRCQEPSGKLESEQAAASRQTGVLSWGV